MRKSESRTSRDDHIPRSKLEELERKRREWKIEQERLREHERRKQKMIQEYEERRARELRLKNRDRRSRSRSYSRHRSRSQSKEREKNVKSGGSSAGASASAKVPVMSEKCDSSSSNTPLFKGSEGSQISITELKKIKVNIQRNLSGSEEPTELLRDIVNPEEIIVQRREDEGSKPIFDREDLKRSSSEISERRTIVAVENCESREGSKPIFEREELKSRESSASKVEERRTVVSVGNTDSRKRRSTDRRSRSASLVRHSRSPQHSSRHESRSRTYSESRHKSYKRDKEDRDSRSKYHDRDRHPSYRRQHRSSSAERTYSSRSRDTLPPRDSQDYERGFRGRRGADDWLSDPRVMPPPYVESLPIPVYYDNRPVMVDPMMMMRPPLPMVRGRAPPMIFRPPFRPRFIPQEMFRPNIPPHTRFGRTF